LEILYYGKRLKALDVARDLKVMENVRERAEAAPIDANEIARAQLLRFRRRLGALTHDQELQIEELVISVVMKISLVTQKAMEALAKNSPSIGS
jgi:hypothetical protein